MGDDAGRRLAEATQVVYAVEPAEFIATRASLVAEAKQEGDAAAAQDIGRLRKPSVAAWALNQVVRERPEVVERLQDVGERLRDAQSRVDAAAMKDLRPERDALLQEFVSASVDVAAGHGTTLGAGPRDEVHATVIAALAGEEATEAVASGTLTRALSYSGLGEVDLVDAVVRGSSGAILSVVEGEGRGTSDAAVLEHPARRAPDGRADAERALAEAEAALESAEQDRTVAGDSVDAARGRAADAAERIAELEQDLADAREEERAARAAVTDAVRARKDAQRAHASAEKALARARATLGG